MYLSDLSRTSLQCFTHSHPYESNRVCFKIWKSSIASSLFQKYVVATSNGMFSHTTIHFNRKRYIYPEPCNISAFKKPKDKISGGDKELMINHPTNLLFAGGCATNAPYIGALSALEHKSNLNKLVRVGGTSSGAVVAAIYASGYRGKNLEHHLQYDLKKFLVKQYSTDDVCQKVNLGVTREKRIFIPMLHLFSLYSRWGQFTKDIDRIKNSRVSFDHITHGLYDRKAFCYWLNKRIEEGTSIKNCTFGELANLVKTNPDRYKHLHVFANAQNRSGKLFHFSSESKTWNDLVIADAVSTSMTFPGIIRTGHMRFKRHDSKLYFRGDLPKDLIVGHQSHFPIHLFDLKKYGGKHGEPNNHTLGIRLTSCAPSKINLARALNPNHSLNMTRAVFAQYQHLLDCQENISKIDSYNVVTIPVGEMKSEKYDIHHLAHKRLVEAGYHAITAFYNVNDPPKQSCSEVELKENS